MGGDFDEAAGKLEFEVFGDYEECYSLDFWTRSC